MAGLEKYNSPAKQQRIGNDAVYGKGNDGNVVISSNTILSRDMYYENLTINNGVQLDPNGYRIFVKNTLTLNGNVALAANVTGKTIAGSAQVASGNLSLSVGGNSASNTYTTTKLTDSQKKDLLSIFDGIFISSDGSTGAITGGAGGATGTLTPATGGGSGHLSRNALVAGGPGTSGTNVPVASGGVGGGVIFLCARTIVGSGYIITNGTNAGASATGSAGSAAPSASLQHYADGAAHYITGDGTHGPHASVSSPNLPHGGHVPATTNALYGHTYRHVHRGHDHGRYHDHYNPFFGPAGYYTHSYDYANHGGGNYGHTWNTHGPYYPDNGTYYHINGIPHSYPHRPHGGVAYSGDLVYHGNGDVAHGGGTHGAHFNSYSDNPVGSHFHTPANHNKIYFPPEHGGNHYPRNHQDINYTHVRHRNAGTVSHSGHATYPGGSAGSAGSTTAGKSGGGGGIIIITDSLANTVSTSTTGGSVGGVSGESGTVVTIVNT